MTLVKKVAVMTALLLSSQLAVASDDCVKPSIKGVAKSDMVCLGEGLVKFYEPYGEWGESTARMVDKTGKVLLPKGKFSDIFKFSEGLAGVITTDYKAGFINKSGKFVIAPIYEPAISGDGGEISEVNSFSEGLVSVAKLGRGSYGEETSLWGFIDKTGNTVIPFKYAAAGNFGSGLAPVAKLNDSEDNYIWGFVDKAGQTKIPFNYDYAGSFSEGVAVVARNEKYGVIDVNNKLIVPFKYDYMGDYSEGLAPVFLSGTPLENSDEITGKFGYIDKTGKVVIPIQHTMSFYEYIDLPSFHNGKVKVEKWDGEKDNSYCINKTGKKVTC